MNLFMLNAYPSAIYIYRIYLSIYLFMSCACVAMVVLETTTHYIIIIISHENTWSSPLFPRNNSIFSFAM